MERATAAAESFRAARNQAEFCAVLGLKEQDGALCADYDENGLAGDGGVYRLTVDVTEEAGTMTADIRVFRGGEELYDLAVRRPGKWGA